MADLGEMAEEAGVYYVRAETCDEMLREWLRSHDGVRYAQDLMDILKGRKA